MGSPDSEKGHKPDEGPQHQVRIEPFWMGKCEVTWDEYDIWSFNLDIQRRKVLRQKAGPHRRGRRRRHSADQTLHRHDVRHGARRLSRHLHDAVGRQDVLQMAEREDGPLLSAADGGRVGIRLPRGHDDGLFVRRRPDKARRLCLVRQEFGREVPQGRPEKAQSVGPVRHARQRGRMGARPVPARLLRRAGQEKAAGDWSRWPCRRRSTAASFAAARGTKTPPRPAARPASSRFPNGKFRIRRFRKASGTLPTPNTSVFASCGRCACPTRPSATASTWNHCRTIC